MNERPRGIAQPPSGEALTSHWPAPATPPAGRAALVNLLQQAQGRGVDGAPPISGITLVDVVSHPSQEWLDTALTASELSLETAAFLMAGYVIAQPGRSGEAMARAQILAVAGHKGADEVTANFTWLKSVFLSQGDASQRSLIDPDRLLAAIQGPGAPATIFPRLIWNAYRLRADRLMSVDAAVETARVQWALDFDDAAGATSLSRSCFYLMAIAAGAIKPGDGHHKFIETLQKTLSDAFSEVKAIHKERQSQSAKPLADVRFTPPSQNSLDAWLKDGAAKIGFDPTKWKDGQPPQKKAIPAEDVNWE